ncbi:hypothetical protein, partial [Xanthomarina gelatinilytica]|uniref:hypothetical protein n=1 Tax=Xanthomarina gelatinilytica TaxID=1137281 RepID=UPI003AA820DE
ANSHHIFPLKGYICVNITVEQHSKSPRTIKRSDSQTPINNKNVVSKNQIGYFCLYARKDNKY